MLSYGSVEHLSDVSIYLRLFEPFFFSLIILAKNALLYRI